MNVTMTTTYGNESIAIPVRVEVDQYLIPSQFPSRIGNVYTLTFNHVTKCWECTCKDTTHNHNPRCKHVRRLAAYIQEQEAIQAAIQKQAAAIAQAVAAQTALETLEAKYMQVTAREAELQATIARQDAEIAALRQELAQAAAPREQTTATGENLLTVAVQALAAATQALASSTAAKRAPTKAKGPVIEEVEGALMVDGYKVKLVGVMPMFCNCPEAELKQCKHLRAAERYQESKGK